LVDAFTIERVLKKSSVFDAEKLSWLNGKHLEARPRAQLVADVRERLAGAEHVDLGTLADDAVLGPVVEMLVPRSRTLEDMAQQAVPFVREPVAYDPEAVSKHWGKDPAFTRDVLERLASTLHENSSWTPDGLEPVVRGVAEGLGVGAGKVIHPLRVALVGQASSPGIFDVLAVLGRARVLARIDAALERVRSL